jgi:hypothetical protein
VNTNNKHLFQLAPTKPQREHLAQIFAGPELLLELLKSEANIPRNYSEIGLFLLKNKAKIYPYICKDMHNNVDILSDAIYKIIKSRQQGIRLDFLGNCSLSKDCFFYFPIERLGLVSPLDSNSILSWRKSLNGRRYIPAFSIIKRDNNIFAEVEIEQINFNQNKTNDHLIVSKNAPLRNKGRRIVKNNFHKTNSSPTDLNNKSTTSPMIDYSSLSHSERKIASAVDIATVIRGKRDSSFNWNWGGGCIWTISGGGGPGTGKKR